MTLALILVSLLAAAVLVWALWEEDARRGWKTTAEAYERQVAFDEAELELLRGPRRSPDVDDPTRGAVR